MVRTTYRDSSNQPKIREYYEYVIMEPDWIYPCWEIAGVRPSIRLQD